MSRIARHPLLIRSLPFICNCKFLDSVTKTNYIHVLGYGCFEDPPIDGVGKRLIRKARSSLSKLLAPKF